MTETIDQPKTTYLKDYTKPSHTVHSLDLTFSLEEDKTHVKSTMVLEPCEDSLEFVLNGEKMELLSVKIDQQEICDYRLDDKSLTITGKKERFTLEIENIIDPKNNLALDGLYKSGSIFCSQNEPQGFRKITYFFDRSDVMTIFTTTIIANKEKYPVLLSNGNLIEEKDLDNGLHQVTWNDPFKKPCYLFALVAGDLGMIQDQYITQSGREVDLRIYCDKGNENKCYHAMEALIHSMKWDEERFNLEYDLDIYMIVAVDAFNMGAMENKGLNIFNTSCVLADQKSATDANFKRVETVIAHEYFHNWTGNRITCRDWFQLTLKEGLTVFRDQEFSSDTHSRAVKRIEDVIGLRARQFPEDAGPTAHPIKPSFYIQINNFYTATVYQKGSEVIRMIETLIGRETFTKGIAKYFELFDGQAVTTEDFVFAMENVSERDLSQFKRWYHQAGTPQVKFQGTHDPKNQKYTLTITQETAPTQDQSPKEPFHFPVKVALYSSKGKELFSSLLEITQKQESFVFENIEEDGVLSFNQNFTAPIQVHAPYSQKEYSFLMQHDKDPFNQWEAGQELAMHILLNKSIDPAHKTPEAFKTAFRSILENTELPNAFKALALLLPDEAAMAERQHPITFSENHRARKDLQKELALEFEDEFYTLYQTLHTDKPYQFNADEMGVRSLKYRALSYLVYTGKQEYLDLAYEQFEKAQHMSDEFSAFTLLCDRASDQKDLAIKLFYERWNSDTLLMNKWLMAQALSSCESTKERIKELSEDPIFDITIPNLVRALYESFVQNLVMFHKEDGSGYQLIKDQIIQLDAMNPQVAARLCHAFKKYRSLDNQRAKHMQRALEELLSHENLSNNSFEILSKCLASRES